jgi:hypothetical protein
VKNERSISRARADPLSFGFDSDSDAIVICIIRGTLMVHFSSHWLIPVQKEKNKFRCMKINMPMLRTSRALVGNMELKINHFSICIVQISKHKINPLYNYGAVAKVDL